MSDLPNPQYTWVSNHNGLEIHVRTDPPARTRKIYRVYLEPDKSLYTYASSIGEAREIIDKYLANPTARFCRVSGYFATPVHEARLIDLCELLGVSQSDLFHSLIDQAWAKEIGHDSRSNHENTLEASPLYH